MRDIANKTDVMMLATRSANRRSPEYDGIGMSPRENVRPKVSITKKPSEIALRIKAAERCSPLTLIARATPHQM